MQLGFVGLGKMGLSMTKRLLQKGHKVVAFDLNNKARNAAKRNGAKIASSLQELASDLSVPRLAWVMVPTGRPTGEVIHSLSDYFSKGDIIVDGGNSYYKESMERARQLRKKDIFFLDVGTSGGVRGLEEGYCFMAGGEKNAYKKLQPVFKALAAPRGYAYVGTSGSGHFVKMVHNGIEYGLLQSYAEGFAALEAKKEFDLDLGGISRLWNHGSVIRSWLLKLCEEVFGKYGDLSSVKGYVQDSGDGRWTVAETISENIPAPIITLSLLERLRSRHTELFSDRVIAALRHEFGGHEIEKKEKRSP